MTLSTDNNNNNNNNNGGEDPDEANRTTPTKRHVAQKRVSIQLEDLLIEDYQQNHHYQEAPPAPYAEETVADFLDAHDIEHGKNRSPTNRHHYHPHRQNHHHHRFNKSFLNDDENPYGHDGHGGNHGLNESIAIGLQLNNNNNNNNNNTSANLNNNNSPSSPTTTTNNNNNVIAEHVPDYNDYLRGQRVMKMKSRRMSLTGDGHNSNNSFRFGGPTHRRLSLTHQHQQQQQQQQHAPFNRGNSSLAVVTGNDEDGIALAEQAIFRGTSAARIAEHDELHHNNNNIGMPDAGADDRFDRLRIARAVVERHEANVHKMDESTRKEEGLGGGGSKDENDDNNNDQDGNDKKHDNHHHHHHHEAGGIPLYCVPIQRQMWGDDQVLPHINWGDIFFDLFYVAAAYNLGVLLISAMNAEDWPRGVVYFLGIFGPIYGTWESDLYYSSRYTVVDHFHRIFDVIRFLLVASVVLHIKTLDLLSDSSSFETFALMISLFLESAMQLALDLELVWYADGDRKAIVNHTTRKIKYQHSPICVVYLTATILAGVLYFQKDTGASGGSSSSASHLRWLAGEAEGGESDAEYGWRLSDVPYIMSMSAHVLGVVVTATRKFWLSHDKTLDVRDHFVPNNVDYLIHRYGEWVMLMIGESVLSLLIVETVESEDYYIIALVGVLTVILIQILKFESEPNHPEGHALLQSMRAATAFTTLIEILSVGLIAFGVSFKVMLTIVQKASLEETAASDCASASDYAYDDDDGHRMLAAAAAAGCDDISSRALAAVPTITDTAASTLYCGSLTVVLISMELMLITHQRGLSGAWELLFKQVGENKRKLNYPLIAVNLTKLALILFVATMCLWQTDPRSIASAGFLVVAALAFSRIVGWGMVNKEEEIKQFINLLETKTKDVARTMDAKTKDVARSVARTAGSVASAAVSLTSKQAENDSVVDAEAFRSAISDTSFDAIVVIDRTGIIRHVNDTTLLMFGYEHLNELVDHNIATLAGTDEMGNFNHYIDEFNQSGKTVATIGRDRVLHSRRKDGSEFPSLIGMKELPGSAFLVGQIRNMTSIGQRHNEGDLAMDPVLRLVDDTSFDCIIVIDMGGVIQHVNITTLSEFGYEFKDELIGNNISMLVGGGHANKHAKYMDRFQKKEKSETVIGKRRELKSRRKDGSEFSCMIAINTIPESDCLIGIIRNVTGVSKKNKSMEADDLSAKGKQQAEDFLDDSFDSIIVANEDGTILRVNQTALETFRYGSKDELIGQNLSLLVGGGEAKHHDKYLANFKKAGTSTSTIGRQRLLLSRRKDGTDFPCVIGIRRMRNSSNLVGFIRDMSEVSQQNAQVIEISNINQLDPVGRLIDDRSFDCIIVFDREGTISKLNQTTVTEFRYSSKADLEGRDFSVLVQYGQEQTPTDFNKLIEPSTIGKQRMLHLTRKDGTDFQGIFAIREIPDTELFVGYIRNMTGIPQEELPKSNVQTDILGHIDETSFDSIIVIDKGGVIQGLNVTTLSEFGYTSKDELVGENISVLVGGGHAEKHNRYLGRFFEMGKSDSVIGKQRILHSRRKDGSEFPCLIGIKMLPDSTDLLIGYIRNMTGFSKQQKAIEVDHMSQSVDSMDTTEGNSGNHQDQVDSGLAQYIDESSFDSIILTDLYGMIKAVNQTTLIDFGYDSKDALLHKNISILVGGGQADKHDGYIEKFRTIEKTGASIGKKRRLLSRRQDGTEFPCMVGIKKIPAKDLLIGYITDISGT